MNKKMIAGILTALMILGLSLPAFAAELKVAYVDVGEVFDNYQKTKDQDLVLKTAGEAKEKERNESRRFRSKIHRGHDSNSIGY